MGMVLGCCCLTYYGAFGIAVAKAAYDEEWCACCPRLKQGCCPRRPFLPVATDDD